MKHLLRNISYKMTNWIQFNEVDMNLTKNLLFARPKKKLCEGKKGEKDLREEIKNAYMVKLK